MKYISTRTMLASAVAILGITATASLAFAATVPSTQTVARTVHHTGQNKIHGTIVRKGLGGTVTAISGTTITLSSGGKNQKTYTVDASKAHFLGSKITTISDIHIGDEVVAMGTITGTNVTAKMIIDRPSSEGVPKAFAGLHKTKTVNK